jgi:hypothetical protein
MEPSLSPVNRQEITDAAGVLPGRRLRYRQKISTLAYLNLDHSNGGIIRDLSETGLALQAVSPLRKEQMVFLRFDLLRPRLHVETPARVCWSDARGQAGLEFLTLPDRSRRLLKQWMFIQLLVRAYQAALTGTIFLPAQPAEQPAELLFSDSPRPPIRMEPIPQAGEQGEILPAAFASDPFTSPIRSNSALPARLADGVIVALALTLFAVLALNFTHARIEWPLMVVLAIPSAVLFAVLYWYLFSAGVTPGAHMTRCFPQARTGVRPEEPPRFR